MSIRPVDLQVMMPQVSEAGKVMNHDQQNQRPEVMYQHFSEKLQKESARDEQRVTNTNKSEQGKVDKDGRRGSGGKEEKGKQSDKDKHSDHEEPPRGMFDMSI